MTWKATFDKGVACYKHGDLDGALTHMNQAAELQNDAFIIYDSRAAVHERLGDIKAALLDSKRVIELAPNRWQGYARSARLFSLLEKHSSAIKMVGHALSRLRPDDVQRRAQLLELQEKAVAVQADVGKQRSSQIARSSYLLGKLPVETLVEIFTLLINENHKWVVKLSHVCGHWRHILINTPSAWQSLVLHKKRPLQKAKLWKQRANNRISRIEADMSQLDTPSVFTELMDLSWDSLSNLLISGGAFLELYHMLFGASIPYPFSKLRELTLFDCTSSDQLSCCLTGPSWKLITLDLSGHIHMRDEWWQRIQQLKVLRLSGLLVGFSIQVFATNPSLEEFVMIGRQIVIINPNNDVTPTAMNNLKRVEFHDSIDPFCVARAIIAPSVTSFAMSAIAKMADETLLHIASCSSLVELRISNCSLGPSTLRTLLSSTSNLETLEISSVHAVVNEVFQFLATERIHPFHGLPCRALKHVDVSGCSDLTTSSVHAFVKIRVRYAAEPVESVTKCAFITSLNVDRCPNIEADMLPWFRSKVARFSCIYATKKDFRKDRRRYPQL